MPCAKKRKKKSKKKKWKFQSETSVSALVSTSESQSACYFYFGRKDVKVSFNHSEGKYIHLYKIRMAETDEGRKVTGEGQSGKKFAKIKLTRWLLQRAVKRTWGPKSVSQVMIQLLNYSLVLFLLGVCSSLGFFFWNTDPNKSQQEI